MAKNRKKDESSKDEIAVTPQGNRIIRIGRKHGSKGYLSKNWYLKLYPDGKVVRRQLFEGKVKSAELADHIKNFLRLPGKTIEDVDREFFGGGRTPTAEASASLGASYATLGEVLDFHAKSLRRLDIKPGTAKGYQEALLLVVRHALAFAKNETVFYERGKKVDSTKLREYSTEILTARLVREFKDGYTGNKTGEANTKAKRSANSYLGKAQAIFSKPALIEYQEGKIRLPDLREFTAAVGYGRIGGGYVPPGDGVISQLIHGADTLDNETCKVFVLALFFGLRRAEILAARFKWVNSRGKLSVQEVEEFKPKSGAVRTIENLGAWERLFALSSPHDNEMEHILRGTKTQRIEAVNRCIAYVEGQGLKEQKPLHELRKL